MTCYDWSITGGCVFCGGEGVLRMPFRAGTAHVVQLGTIRVENAWSYFCHRRAETLSNFTREGGDERELMRGSGTRSHHLENPSFPLPFWSKGI